MVNTDLVTGVAAMRRFMNANYFEEQRRDMVATVKAITDHMARAPERTAHLCVRRMWDIVYLFN
jgi:DNA-binding IclR family transcriptional regulator